MAADTYNKAYKFRIYPNEEQKKLFAKTFGCVRFVYNHYLYIRKMAYETEKKSISYHRCANDLPRLKSEHEWLKAIDSIALQQSLKHLDTAFQNFFRDKKIGYPKFKSRKNHHNSYTTCVTNGNVSLENGYLKLPKARLVKVKQHRNIPTCYTLKSATVSQTPTGKYFVSLLYSYTAEITPKVPMKSIGLDFSMPNLFVSSERDTVVDADALHCFRKAQEKLKREQKRLSHCQKQSCRYKKQKYKVAKIHEKAANQRKDYLHKVSRQITNAYDVVCIEDLNMKAMSQSLNFGKSVADNGWGMFTAFLGYKLSEQGKQLVKVSKWFASSKTCGVCGYKNTQLTLKDRSWMCPECGTLHNRDTNASHNIKTEGMKIIC